MNSVSMPLSYSTEWFSFLKKWDYPYGYHLRSDLSCTCSWCIVVCSGLSVNVIFSTLWKQKNVTRQVLRLVVEKGLSPMDIKNIGVLSCRAFLSDSLQEQIFSPDMPVSHERRYCLYCLYIQVTSLNIRVSKFRKKCFKERFFSLKLVTWRYQLLQYSSL